MDAVGGGSGTDGGGIPKLGAILEGRISPVNSLDDKSRWEVPLTRK